MAKKPRKNNDPRARKSRAGGQERRRFPRAVSRLRMTLRAARDTSATWYRCRVEDIGLGGVRCVAACAERAGTAVQLQLVLPQAASPLRVSGSIVWSLPAARGAGRVYGIEFTRLQGAQRSTIDALVTRYHQRHTET